MKAFTVRLPDELYDKLEERRIKNQRKKNDELIVILREVLMPPEGST